MELKKMINGKEETIIITDDEFKTIALQRKKEAKPTKVVFSLTMPKNNAWNNKWSGDNETHAIILDKNKIPNVDKLIKTSSFSYDFGDGWIAEIKVSLINNYEASLIKKNNQGFFGYDWMVQSIISNGEIKN